jgi:hypothetical protein
MLGIPLDLSQALPGNIRLGLKYMFVTITLAYSKMFYIKFKPFGPSITVINTFSAALDCCGMQ